MYDDPVTLPAGDIADNAYYGRDVRRAYPRLSVVRQPDVVGLLTVGSKASPKEDVLQIGNAGTKQLAEIKTQGEEKGLALYFESKKGAALGILGPNGLPPLPSGMYQGVPSGAKGYKLLEAEEQAYPDAYVTIVPDSHRVRLLILLTDIRVEHLFEFCMQLK